MELEELLESLYRNDITVKEALSKLSLFQIENIQEGLVRFDLGRKYRKGIPEVVFAEEKSYDDIFEIGLRVVNTSGFCVISRIDKKFLKKLEMVFKNKGFSVEIGKKSTTMLISKPDTIFPTVGRIGILCAGTSDIGIAEEARIMAKAMGCSSLTFYDVGIAGFHRLLPALKDILNGKVSSVIVVAGMEGALASVVSSLIDIPVIGVPTSVGYGYGSNGYASLASMLQTCSFGVAVVNIDNGVGAGAFASMVAKRLSFRKDNS